MQVFSLVPKYFLLVFLTILFGCGGGDSGSSTNVNTTPCVAPTISPVLYQPSYTLVRNVPVTIVPFGTPTPSNCKILVYPSFLPPGLSVDNSSGMITGIPSSPNVSTYVVSILIYLGNSADNALISTYSTQVTFYVN